LEGNGDVLAIAYAVGRKLVIAPESDQQRMVVESKMSDIQLLDGHIQHNNLMSYFNRII
jgi:endoglucanase